MNREVENWKELKTWLKDQPLDEMCSRQQATAYNTTINKMIELEKKDIAERVVEILKKIRFPRRRELVMDVLNALDSGDTSRLEEWCK